MSQEEYNIEEECFKHSRTYDPKVPVEIPRQQIADELRQTVQYVLAHLVNHSALPDASGRVDQQNTTIYTGAVGIALMHFHLSKLQTPIVPGYNSITAAARILEAVEPMFQGLNPAVLIEKGASFYMGPPGYYALSAAVATIQGDLTRAKVLLEHLLSYAEFVKKEGQPNQLLYGRCGYLSALRFAEVNSQIPIPGDLTRELLREVIADGEREGIKLKGLYGPLAWSFFGQRYAGAAHGNVGILYVILCWWDAVEDSSRSKVAETIELYAQYALSNEGLPFLIWENPKVNVYVHHWCHGFPGLIPLLVKWHQISHSSVALNAAMKCTETVWELGVLRKGVGLCHGAFGNAYSFLSMYRATKNDKYLFYALSFFDICCGSSRADYEKAVSTYRDPQRSVQGLPNAPYSLMEGLAGTACFLGDLLNPEASNFPGYEITVL